MDMKRFGHALLQGNILALPRGTEENHKHDRKSVYNIALTCNCVSTVALESNKYYMIWVCVCSLSYPASKAHALYHIVTWGLMTLSHNQHNYQKKVTEHKKHVCWIFPTNFIWDIAHSEKIQWDIITNIHRSSRNIPVILIRLQDFLKFLNIKFHKNASSGRRVVPCRWKDGGWTDTQTDMMKLSVAFHNLVNVPKNGNIFYSQKSVKELFQLWQKICLRT